LVDNNKIVEALRKVMDPNTGQDIIQARMIQDLKVTDDNVSFTLVLPTLNSPHKSDLNFACQRVIQDIYPSVNVDVHMKANTTQSQQSTSPITQVKNIIAVASGKGGVGKSTVSVNLALGLKKLGARVGLIDADLYGPSIPTMLGLQGQRPKVKDVYGKAKIEPLDAYGMPVMLIVDLPPGTGDIQLTLVQTVPVTGSVIVTTPQEVAVADAIKAMSMFQLPSVNVPILGVVENMSWFTPKELPNNKYHIFGEGGGKKLAKMSKSVLLGQVPLVQGIREAGDSGKPALLQEDSILSEPFVKVAENTLRQVGIRNETMDPTKIIQVKS